MRIECICLSIHSIIEVKSMNLLETFGIIDLGVKDLSEEDLLIGLDENNFSELDNNLDNYTININPESYLDSKSGSLRLNKTDNFNIPCYQLDVYIELLKTKYNIDEQNYHKLFIYNTENGQLDKSVMHFPINQMKNTLEIY